MPRTFDTLVTEMVAKRIGVHRELAAVLLADALGSRRRSDSAARLSAFVVATSALGRLLPGGVRRRAVGSLLVPLLNSPRAANRYAAAREPKHGSCSGLTPLA